MSSEPFQYKGEKFSIRFDPKEEIFFVEIWGSHIKNDSIDFIKNTSEMIEKFGVKNFYALIDVSRQKTADHEARRLYNQWLTDRIMPSYAALCGGNLIVRMMANFILTAGRIKNKMVKSEAFATTEEGLKWLRKMKVKERQDLNR